MRTTARALVAFVWFAIPIATTQTVKELEVDEARLALRRDFAGRMGKAIPPRTLLRFFQIDNKLDSVVRADISRQIPLLP